MYKKYNQYTRTMYALHADAFVRYYVRTKLKASLYLSSLIKKIYFFLRKHSCSSFFFFFKFLTPPSPCCCCPLPPHPSTIKNECRANSLDPLDSIGYIPRRPTPATGDFHRVYTEHISCTCTSVLVSYGTNSLVRVREPGYEKVSRELERNLLGTA